MRQIVDVNGQAHQQRKLREKGRWRGIERLEGIDRQMWMIRDSDSLHIPGHQSRLGKSINLILSDASSQYPGIDFPM